MEFIGQLFGILFCVLIVAAIIWAWSKLRAAADQTARVVEAGAESAAAVLEGARGGAAVVVLPRWSCRSDGVAMMVTLLLWW